ncbi:MAG: heavy metal sensor histidine kinase [Gammaproteobacteria bacterium]|nr:heavy metal sensor histidine kinase [Gammaproteobacteria bacterium]
MFSKYVNFFKRISIAARLSILYAVTSCIMLSMISLYAYWALTDTLGNANEKFVKDEIRVLRNILYKHQNNSALLSQELEWVPEELEASEYHYYARIVDPKTNQVSAMTEGMRSIFSDVEFPSPAKATEDPEETYTITANNNNTYLLISALAKVGDTNSIKLIEVALDITPQQKIIATYQRNLFFVLFLGIVGATLLGIFIARKGMRFLNEITHYAERISISQLNSITLNHCPKELLKLVSALNNMLQRIENAFKRLSLFSKELAHELRTPINNLMGEAEITLSRPRPANEYEEVIASSIEEYHRISRMIENILFLARTENPSIKLICQKIALVNEFEKIAENFEPLLQENEITLLVEGDEEVLAEPNLLRRVLNNLISNAIRYTSHKGKITLNCTKDDSNIYINVRDNGIGIGKEHLPYICDRFYRIKHDDTYAHGLGLGLSIVSSIMELHGGSLQITSALGEGTSVKLIFPHN